MLWKGLEKLSYILDYILFLPPVSTGVGWSKFLKYFLVLASMAGVIEKGHAISVPQWSVLRWCVYISVYNPVLPIPKEWAGPCSCICFSGSVLHHFVCVYVII